MPNRIITIEDFRQNPRLNENLPNDFVAKRCRSKKDILKKLEINSSGSQTNAPLGLSFTIIRRPNKPVNISIGKYFGGRVTKSFVILKEVLEAILVGANISLDIYIYENPTPYLYVIPSQFQCNEVDEGTGGEGVKVKIPTFN